MIFPAVTTIGMICPHCGKIQYKTISAFSLANNVRDNFFCSCGTSLLTLLNFKHQNKKVSIEYQCIYCGKAHHRSASRKAIWGTEPISLVCNDKARPIGYFGPRQTVVALCQETKRDFVEFVSEFVSDDEEFASETDDFFIVYGVMEILDRMADKGQLSCECGSHDLSVEILPDKIELFCASCHAVGIINTENKSILRTLDEVGAIRLDPNMIQIVNDTIRKITIKN
ncbi:hypothetical protein LPY66_20450 [Dehalobacter sp. DCM]|uniref:hypothetical protein n=1 Tax=Dehalobacter sp. DCM TaxID=2907827 RepID=UPI003081BAFC|nr:hypothetical protein LPY66_20450 [Dehalobacter sp. DCM]